MIKPNELMLGNWVYQSEDDMTPMKVSGISKDSVSLDYDEFSGLFGISCDEIFPIPLEKEMFEKNGFIESVYDKDKYINLDIPTDDDFSVVQVAGEGFAVYMFGRLHKIEYVHELQNILNIAGIDFDFKI